MYRTRCVLALIALYARLADTFSWDIVVSSGNELEFYNEGTLTHSLSNPTSDSSIAWMTYDSSNNRILFSNRTNDGKCSLLHTFDIATGKTEPLIKSNPCRDIDHDSYVYDPVTGLLFGAIKNPSKTSTQMYSFLVKSGYNNDVGDGNLVVDFRYDVKKAQPMEFAVESCGGYIYWTTSSETNRIERARFNGSDREIIIDAGNMYRHALTIDSQTQKMYFCENEFYHILSVDFFLVSTDLDGNNRKTIYKKFVIGYNSPSQLTVSKSFIYWTVDRMSICQLPKNPPNDTNVLPKQFLIDTTPHAIQKITANYKFEEQTQGTPLSKGLKNVSSSYTATEDSLNLSAKVNLLHVNKTKVSEEYGIREGCDISYQYYCLQGTCSISAEGQPKCRCNAGYSGQRCEVEACLRYCLNEGICSLNETSEPVCRCTHSYEGDRCEVNVFEPESFQHLFNKTMKMLKKILNEGSEVESTL